MDTQDAPMPDGPRLVFETRLDAPPETVWRALTAPGVREKWLPAGDLAQNAPVHSTPGAEVRYRVRDADAPDTENIVAFTLSPDASGGTLLRIVHACAALPLSAPRAANGNTMAMRAA